MQGNTSTLPRTLNSLNRNGSSLSRNPSIRRTNSKRTKLCRNSRSRMVLGRKVSAPPNLDYTCPDRPKVRLNSHQECSDNDSTSERNNSLTESNNCSISDMKHLQISETDLDQDTFNEHLTQCSTPHKTLQRTSTLCSVDTDDGESLDGSFTHSISSCSSNSSTSSTTSNDDIAAIAAGGVLKLLEI